MVLTGQGSGLIDEPWAIVGFGGGDQLTVGRVVIVEELGGGGIHIRFLMVLRCGRYVLQVQIVQNVHV